MQIKINLQIFIFIIIFILTHQIQIYSLLMLFGFLHEMGHLIVGMSLGLKPKSLHIIPFGLAVVFETYTKKKAIVIKKILIASAGPIVNVLIILVVMFLDLDSNLRQTIIYSNILIFVFNLLPIYPLDGGRIIKGLIRLKYGNKDAEKLVNKMSNIIIVLLTIVSSILVMYFRNIGIFFAVMYLWIIVIKENRKYRTRRRVYDAIQKEKLKVC